MLKKEHRYEFKKDLLQVHKKDRRDLSLKATPGEFEITNGVNILLPTSCDSVILTAAKDFSDYLLTSMKLSSMVTYCEYDNTCLIKLVLNTDIEEASGYMGYRISFTDNTVLVEGYDSRGIAQGLYFLEDLMNLRKGPFLERKVIKKKALFSPRLIQSPFGMFEFTDECLSYLAHLGYDALELWIKGLNLTKRDDYLDMYLLCERAEKYGIKIYIELYAPHSMHPSDPGAQSFYDNLYGKIFEACPKICGLTLLGEAIGFPSRDPNPKVGSPNRANNYVDNIPTGKIHPGWWPCLDYPEWISMIRRSAHKYNPDAEIILCTYNWGGAPEEDRIKLIEALPDGIAIMPTWDAEQQYKLGDITEQISDYSLCTVGPGDYFKSEAIAAKKRGMKLFTNAQCAGRTWDFGLVPYEPMPYQWLKRYEGMLKAHDEWNLCGILETIHYAFQPSIISELEKWAFFTHTENLEDVLKALLKRDFGDENIDTVDKAMHLWSEAITHYIPSVEDQYGPFRIGPAYPLWIKDTSTLPEGGKIKAEYNAMFGNRIYNSEYKMWLTNRCSLLNVRCQTEIEELETLAKLMQEGICELEKIEKPNDRLLKLINLGEYIYHCCITAINVKNLYYLKTKLAAALTTKEVDSLLDQIEVLLRAEAENVEKTIPIVQNDSRLGWEPSMEYMGDEKCLRWKLRQLDHELTKTIATYRQANSL